MNQLAYFHASAEHGLNRVEHLLKLIENAKDADDLLKSRFAPDMFTLAEQLSVAIGMTLRGAYPLAGRDAPDLGIMESVEKCRDGIAKARAGLEETKRMSPISQPIKAKAGEASPKLLPEAYVHQFVLPNLWFHVSMAYAIMRAEGLEVSKGDFDGVHYYPRGFAFEN